MAVQWSGLQGQSREIVRPFTSIIFYSSLLTNSHQEHNIVLQHTKDQTMVATKTYVRVLVIVTVLLIGAGKGKDVCCNRPVTKSNCNASETYITGWENTGWFFEPILKVCLPFFTRDGWHVCPQNYVLPSTREMCEALCAQPCTMWNGSMGICMSNEICRIDYYHVTAYPNTCGNRRLNCCPRITDNRLFKYSDPTKDPDGILISARRKTNAPSHAQPVYYIYHLPIVHLDGKLYK